MERAPLRMGGIVMDIHIIHGWTYNLDRWKNILKLLKKAGYNPIVHNVPGLTSTSDRVWSVPDYVEWLRREIGDAKEPTILAHSNGGRISLAYCMQYSDHIKHLILLDSAGVQDKRTKTRLKKGVFFILSKVLKPLSKIHIIRKIIYRFLKAQDYNNASESMKLTMRNMLSYDKNIKLKKIFTPVTLIWGEKDTYTPVYQGKIMRDKLANLVSWNEIAGAGHSPHDSHPEQVINIIKNDIEIQ